MIIDQARGSPTINIMRVAARLKKWQDGCMTSGQTITVAGGTLDVPEDLREFSLMGNVLTLVTPSAKCVIDPASSLIHEINQAEIRLEIGGSHAKISLR